MSLDRSVLLKRLAASWPWIIACVPALVLLVILMPLRVPVPSYDSWAFVQQYLKWTGGGYSWHEFFAKHGDHPSAVGKAIYFGVLHFLKGDVGLLLLLNWVLMLVVAGCACFLSRPVWAGNRVLGAVLMFCVTLTIFSAAQAGAWLWDFTFQNLIPGACLAAGVVLLTSGALSSWRIAIAALLSLTAIFSVGGGFLVGALFSVLIWQGMAGKSTLQKALAACAWLAGTGIAAWVALKAFGHAEFTEEGPSPSLTVLLDRPLMRWHFVLVILGQVLGKGTVSEPETSSAVAGGVLLVVFLACIAAVFRHRADRQFVSAALPWIIFSLFGLGSAGLIGIGRMGKSDNAFDAFHNIYALAERTLAERFTNLTLFFVFGVVMLAAVVARSGGVSCLTSRWLKLAAAPALTAFIFIQVLNWQAGWQLMKLENMLMKQERAMIGFGTFLRLDGNRLWNRQLKYHTFDFAKSLADRGRLAGVDFMADNTLRPFQRGKELPKKWAGFEPPMALDGGGWMLAGTCGVPSHDYSGLPDLVVITADAAGDGERIVALAAPRLPETFLERQSQRRKYPEHYFGWSEVLGPASLLDKSSFPKAPFTLRAYAFDSSSRILRPINGSHKVDSSSNVHENDPKL